MLTHATLRALFFCLSQSKLIIWHSGDPCKTNFYDRGEVVRTAKDLVRRGVVLCVVCNGFLVAHGSYPRHIEDEEGNSADGWVAQLHCDNCNVYPALIPDFIMPHKHYKASVIEWVIAENEAGRNVERTGGCSADASTMRRWVRQFGYRGPKAVGWLLSIMLSLYERQISLLELQNRTLLKQLARLLREYPVPKGCGVVGGVNIILTTQNRGFL